MPEVRLLQNLVVLVKVVVGKAIVWGCGNGGMGRGHGHSEKLVRGMLDERREGCKWVV